MKKGFNAPIGRTMDELKNSEIIKKARMTQNGFSQNIQLNHLSPVRIENNFKDIEAVSLIG